MLLLLLLLLLLLAERRESHMYGDAPTKFTKSMSLNPTYNMTSIQEGHEDTDPSPLYHTFENSLYHEETGAASQDNEHTAVYAQVTSTTLPSEISSQWVPGLNTPPH